MAPKNEVLSLLRDVPPWDWPPDAGATFLAVLRDARASKSDRLVAAELAGDFVVVNDELAGTLLEVLGNRDEPEDLRGQAAISLGPALESADTDGFEDPDDVPISERMFHAIQEALRGLHADAGVPTEVRRRVLEASVRARQPWHTDAVRAAFRSGDEDWKLTAVFCMQYVRGFERQILAALSSENPEIACQAVRAAGAWELREAWPKVKALAVSDATGKDLRLAAIEAAGSIHPGQARAVLDHLLDSRDEDVVEAVREALLMAESDSGGDGEDDVDEEDEDDEPLR